MPKRKVLQTVIVHRDGQRLKPAIGAIFDFSESELNSIIAINPDSLGKPVITVDIENEEAARQAQQKAAAAEEAERLANQKAAEAAAAEAAAKKGSAKNQNKAGAGKADDDEV